MSYEHPTHGRRTVPLELPAAQTAILHDELNGWIAGIEEDLADPRGLSDRYAAFDEAKAFRRLLTAVESREIVLPDEEARAAMAKAAEGYDEAAGIENAVAVHDAHRALLDVLDGADRARGCVR
ncbi:MAG TPA: hypothetical protein VGC32_18010 [Solirubrobacterales bacterium]